MNTAYLLMGGNIGDRIFYLQHAQKFVEQECGAIVKYSSIYETAAWGMTGQPSFYNQVIAVSTRFSPEILMQFLLSIEEKMGRKRLLKNGPRTIDIDILLMNDLIINTNLLIIPHPRLAERKFALTPLAEIAGNIIHPILKKSIQQLLNDCKDELDVHKISSAA